MLAVVDDFTRECLGLVADIPLSGLLAEIPSVVHEHLFSSLAAARQIIEAWMTDHNRKRPHSSLDGLTQQPLQPASSQGIRKKASACERGRIGGRVRPLLH